MPTFDFYCSKCDANFADIQPMGAMKPTPLAEIPKIERKAECPTCGNVSKDRVYSKNVYFIGASVENAEYNPAFGQVVKNSRHRKELAKEKGLIEIGNEKPENIHKKFDQDRAEKLKKSWDDV